jgi:hypothetical protein
MLFTSWILDSMNSPCILCLVPYALSLFLFATNAVAWLPR